MYANCAVWGGGSGGPEDYFFSGGGGKGQILGGIGQRNATYWKQVAWALDRADVKIKNHGLGQYGAELHYSTLPFWQLCALKG